MALQPDDMISLLLNACPTAKPAWIEHLADWPDETPGQFLNMAVFARHIVQCDTDSQSTEFPAFFELVERFIADGTDEVRGLAVVGLLEDLQTIASHFPQGTTRLEPLLGPLSRKAWNELIGLWDGKSSLMDVIRTQKSDA
jgi:hypothetical protein